MRHTSLFLISSLVVATATIGPASGALRAAPQSVPAPAVAWNGSTLTVTAKDVRLATLVAAIADEAGISVTGADQLTGLVTIALDGEGLEPAIAAVLKDYSYAMLGPDASKRYTLRILHPRQGRAGGRVPIALSSLPPDNAEGEEPGESDADADRDQQQEWQDELARAEAEDRFGKDAQASRLAEDCRDENPFIRARALSRLNESSPARAVRFLIDALDDDDATVSAQAAELLKDRTDAGTIAAVGQVVARPGPFGVRVAGLKILAYRAEPEGAPYLRAVLHDDNEIIRDAAAEILKELERRAAKSAK